MVYLWYLSRPPTVFPPMVSRLPMPGPAGPPFFSMPVFFVMACPPLRILRGLSSLLLSGFVLALFPFSASAQSNGRDVSVAFRGIIQTEASYGWVDATDTDDDQARLGVGLRRTRLLVTASAGPKVGGFIHFDADNGTFGVLDAYVSYQANPKLRVRVGRMASAQPRAFILTPVVAMDATERAAVALLWHGGTLGSKARDFGIDLRYRTAQAEVIAFVHNGDGSFDRLRSNYQPNIVGDVTSGAEWGVEDMAASGYAAFFPKSVPGLEIGGFVGYNGRKNPNTAVDGQGRDYFSYAGHVYWGAAPGSQPIRLKADVIGVQYEALSGVPTQQTLGLSALGALAVHRAAEVFGRVETYDADLDADNARLFFITAGVSFSLSKLRGQPYQQERLTFGYNLRLSDEDEAPMHHLAILQLQLNF